MSVRHLARAHGSTGAAVLAYRVDVHVGNHELIADEPTIVGGGDLGPSPIGLLVSALAACTATTLRMYAERNGWDLATIEVDIRYDVDGEDQRSISRTITVPDDVTAEQRLRFADIAERTPVTLAIRGGTPITTTLQPATPESPSTSKE